MCGPGKLRLMAMTILAIVTAGWALAVQAARSVEIDQHTAARFALDCDIDRILLRRIGAVGHAHDLMPDVRDQIIEAMDSHHTHLSVSVVAEVLSDADDHVAQELGPLFASSWH